MSKKLIMTIVMGFGLVANAQLGPPPVLPAPYVQRTCLPTDQACLTSEQTAMASYTTTMANYNTQLQRYIAAEEAANAAAAAAAQARAVQEAALAAAKRAEKENQKGSSAYGTSQILSTAVSMAMAAVCSSGPPGAWACPVAAFFAMMAGKAGDQKASHEASKFDACTAASQISTAPANCGAAPAPYNPSGWPSNSTTPIADTFSGNGNCIGTQAQCQAILDNLPPGTNIRNVMDGMSQFAAGKGPFTVNPDGSIKMKNGKNYGLDAFDSKKSMMDAGLSAAQADSLLAMMNKQKVLGELDAKAALAKENDLGGGDVAAGIGAGKPGEGTLNGDADGLGKDSKKDRGLASEGLTKDFNGELIGAAGDNIFKMMNRRYRLKSKQDSFLTFTP